MLKDIFVFQNVFQDRLIEHLKRNETNNFEIQEKRMSNLPEKTVRVRRQRR